MNEESRQIEHLKRIFDNLERYWNSIEMLLGHVSKPLLVDDRGLANILMHLRETLQQTVDAVAALDLTQTLGEIKFIGKKLHQIEADIAEMKNEGIKKKVELQFSCDGYELKKKNVEHITTKNADELLHELMDTLTERESKAIIHRLGLFGIVPTKTFVSLGKILGVTKERASQIYMKAIRKLRMSRRYSLVEACGHKGLIKEVLGEE